MLRLQQSVVGYPRFLIPTSAFLFQPTASGVNLMQFKWKIPAFIYWIRIAAHAGRQNERCSYKISYLSRNLNKTFVWLQQQDMDMGKICSRVKLNNVCDIRGSERPKDPSEKISWGLQNINLCKAPVADSPKSVEERNIRQCHLLYLTRCHPAGTHTNTHSSTICGTGK